MFNAAKPIPRIAAAALLLAIGMLFVSFEVLPTQPMARGPSEPLMPMTQDSLPLFEEFPAPARFADSTFNFDDSVPTTAPQCAKWEAFDLRLQQEKVFRKCSTIDSNDDRFDVQLCMSERFCGQAYFLIERRNKETCAKDYSTSISRNQRYESYLKEKYGPDLFHIMLSGPEKASSSMWQHLGNCTYKIPFRVVNPGIYNVTILLAYEQFRGFSEIGDDWPQTSMDSILPNDFVIDICSDICAPFTSKQVSEDFSLPICSRTEPQQGVYLPISNETVRERKYESMYGHKYIWEPLGCRFDQRFESRGNDSCLNLRDFALKIYGDSQIRGAWFALDARLSGVDEPVLNNIKWERAFAKFFNPADIDKNKYPNLTSKIEEAFRKGEIEHNDTQLAEQDPRALLKGVTLGLEFWSHMEGFTDVKYFRDHKEGKGTPIEIELAPYDAVVFNGAHWPSAGQWQGGHFTTERYVRLIEYAATYMQEIGERRPSEGYKPIDFVWFGANAMTLIPGPKHKHIDWKDWRNIFRLKVGRLREFRISTPWGKANELV
ncbi:hypothetical protein HDU82_001330 [Entophlyctis luteolus]|nr:hypothetical protein HDU82_001330 [Entophlyctis luteolus]